MRTIDASQNRTLYIGYQGEDKRTVVKFPTACLTDDPESGTFTLFAKRNGDSSSYPVPISLDDNEVIWVVRDVDTAKIGHGEAQLVFYDGSTSKTKIWDTDVFESLTVEGGTGEPAEDWVQRIIEAQSQIINLTVSAESVEPSQEASVEKTGGEGEPYNLHFSIPRGQSTQIVSVTATIDNEVGVPYVVVTKGGTESETTLEFAFHNLKGYSPSLLQTIGQSVIDAMSQKAVTDAISQSIDSVKTEIESEIPEVIDSVESESTVSALSANQGRILQQQINEINTEVLLIGTSGTLTDEQKSLLCDSTFNQIRWKLQSTYTDYNIYRFAYLEWNGVNNIVHYQFVQDQTHIYEIVITGNNWECE